MTEPRVKPACSAARFQLYVRWIFPTYELCKDHHILSGSNRQGLFCAPACEEVAPIDDAVLDSINDALSKYDDDAEADAETTAGGGPGEADPLTTLIVSEDNSTEGGEGTDGGDAPTGTEESTEGAADAPSGADLAVLETDYSEYAYDDYRGNSSVCNSTDECFEGLVCCPANIYMNTCEEECDYSLATLFQECFQPRSMCAWGKTDMPCVHLLPLSRQCDTGGEEAIDLLEDVCTGNTTCQYVNNLYVGIVGTKELLLLVHNTFYTLRYAQCLWTTEPDELTSQTAL